MCYSKSVYILKYKSKAKLSLLGVIKYSGMQEMRGIKLAKGGKFCNKPHTLPCEQMSVWLEFVSKLFSPKNPKEYKLNGFLKMKYISLK